MSQTVRRVLLAISILVLLWSSVMLVRSHQQYARELDANASLAELMHAAEEAAAQNTSNPTVPETDAAEQADGEPVILPKLEPLYEMNEDLVGWLSVPGTEIDYPVVYTPYEQNHYLRKAFDGSYAISGTLFLGAPWGEETNHSLIFGHHMRNGSMFGYLNRYAEEAYGLEHRTIRFDTLYEECEYELVAAFYSKVYRESDGDSVFRYYQYADLSDPETFDYYVREAKAAALYDTGVEPEYGDRLLSLSTCEYHTSNGRFVVVACHKESN